MERKRVGTVRWSIRLASLAVASSSGEGPGDEATLGSNGGAVSFLGGAGTSNEQTSNKQTRNERTKLNTKGAFEPRQSAMPIF